MKIALLLICMFACVFSAEAQIKARPGESSKAYNKRLQNSMPKFEDSISEKNILKYEKEQAKIRKEQEKQAQKKLKFRNKIDAIRQSRNLVVWRNTLSA